MHRESASSSASASTPSTSAATSTGNGGGRPRGEPLWGHSVIPAMGMTRASTGNSSRPTLIPVFDSHSGSSSGAAKPVSSAALARKRSRMEKFGSPPPFNSFPVSSGTSQSQAAEDRPVSSHLMSQQGSGSDLMNTRPVTAQGTMSSSHRQHFPSSSTTRGRDPFSPTSVHNSHSRPSTASGATAASSTCTSTPQQNFQPHNHHQGMCRPWASAAATSMCHQPNVMPVSSSSLAHGHNLYHDMGQDMADELDEDVIMMSVDPALLNSGGAASSSSSSGFASGATHQFTMPTTPRHQHQAPTPPASAASSIVSRAPSFVPSTHQEHPQNHSPPGSPLNPSPPHSTQPMTLDQIEAMLQAQLNELTAAFSDVRDVLAHSQWCIDKHIKHVRDTTNAATREKDRLMGAIQGKLTESQALISNPVGSSAVTRQRQPTQAQEQSGETRTSAATAQGETRTAGAPGASGSPQLQPPRGVEGAGYRDYEEQMDLEEMLRSSSSPSNGAGGSPTTTGAAANANANANGSGSGNDGLSM